MSDSPASTPARSSLSPSPIFWTAYPLLYLTLGAVLRALAPRWHVTGREHVPARGGVLLAPNHISDMDPLVVNLSLRRPAWFMAKRELFEIPILAPLIRFAQAFPVERGGADRAALRHAEALLKNRQTLVVFPEGRLSPDGALLPLLPGVTMLALRSGVPIVPVGIHNSNRLLPFGKVCPRPTLAPLRVHFGAPLDLSDLKELPPRTQREQSTDLLEAGLRAAINVARGEK